MSPPHRQLTRAQADDVLRYWLAAVRLEETLKVRPRARRTKHATTVPRLDFPSQGQEYFKLPLADEVAPLLAREDTLQRPFDGELAAFFEGWLHQQYRRSQDESELSHLLCFPVVHLPRGELAGLMRCGVKLRFGSSDGKTFRAPSRSERQRSVYPAPPIEARLALAPRSEGTWPFFIDTRLLSHPLGVSSEDIDALFDRLRARETVDELEMLALVVDTLEGAARDGGSIAPAPPARELGSLLTRMKLAMQTLLARSRTRAEVYPVGIVIDGTQAKTTWHLQRELLSLTEAQGPSDWQVDSCLGSYLTGHLVTPAAHAQRALMAGPALTTHQRRAAESFWGSTLTSVQGPPGTGKTTLILHLCAEALVRQVDSLLDSKVMGGDLLVVASSNNRAVDNVIDPLAHGEGLTLALRVGSRQVCEQTLAVQLRRTAAWLQHSQVEPVGVHNETLSHSLALFAEQRAQLDQLLAPRKRALELAAERARISQLIAAFPPLEAEPNERPHAGKLSREAARAIHDAVVQLEARLEALSQLCTGKPGMAQVNAVARHYEQTAERYLPALETALADVRLTLTPPLPPLKTPLAVAELMEAWEEGAEAFLSLLAGLREQTKATLRQGKRERKLQKLQAALAALGPEVDAPVPEPGGHDALSRELFVAAVSVREAWAKVHAAALLEAVQSALQIVEQERSLRPLFRDEPQHAKTLCRLFGVWGSTLLSLGNCIPADEDSIARVVIDEAGQCHPAHAVSALMRARSALIIGDVHQLAPVIELSTDDEARLLRAARLKVDAETLRPYRVCSDSHVSTQSVAERAVHTRHALVDHFRCQPEIIAISDALCDYGLQVQTPRRAVDAIADVLPHPVSLLDLRGQQQHLAGSLFNELELRETLALIDTLLARGVSASQLAVITPYRGQLEHLRRGLVERRIPLELSPELLEGEGPSPRHVGGLALGTVHRFQGGERSIVLFSSVITQSGSLPFLNARPNLLNVAVSRAQHHFVCLGDRSILSQGRVTRVLVDAALPLER